MFLPVGVLGFGSSLLRRAGGVQLRTVYVHTVPVPYSTGGYCRYVGALQGKDTSEYCTVADVGTGTGTYR